VLVLVLAFVAVAGQPCACERTDAFERVKGAITGNRQTSSPLVPLVPLNPLRHAEAR
jgi:hypothetical protein